MLGDKLKYCGFAAIIGAPNSGKSTFLNAVLNSKVSIVTPKAQTTRNKIRGIYNGEETQIVFTDTPGITLGCFGKLLNRWMNKYSFSAVNDSDFTLFFVDVSKQRPELGIGKEEKRVLDNLSGKTPTILVINKIDSVKPMRVTDAIAVYRKRFDFAAFFAISALKKSGISDLVEGLKPFCKPGVRLFPEDMKSDRDDYFLVSEIIREKLFLELFQELPYSIAVTVESIRDHKTKDILLIDATIHVARASQKGIVLGKKGATLTKIGTRSREDLESVYGCQIGLNLFVRVEEEWFNKEKSLQKVGFEKDFYK